MNKFFGLLAMGGIILLAGCTSPEPVKPVDTIQNGGTQTQITQATQETQMSQQTQDTQTQQPTQQIEKDFEITSPDLSKPISSPLKLAGKMTREFFFEGSFPVALKDGNGKEIARSIAHADPNVDISLIKMVPFTAELTFQNVATTNGTLILEKDNPSGLPENNDSRIIKVIFAILAKNPCEPNVLWKNYKDDQAKVEFCYPPSFTVKNIAIADILIGLGYPSSYFKGTNLETADIYLSAGKDPNCLVSMFDQKPLTKKVTKNGVTFYEDSWGEGAAGRIGENLGYVTEKNGLCYRFVLSLAYENIDNYKDENGKLMPGAPAEFDRAGITKLFQDIFSTLKVK